ncbi:MAG: CDP-glycerol glycerophosphotransferase family protein [Eubacterium sp.]|nr:CDP-glycerol glycerophosphotransferase family protein [Eubacterium sp.]
MGIKGVLKNIKKYGAYGTWKLYRQRDEERRHVADQQRAFLEKEKEQGAFTGDEPEYKEYLRRLDEPKGFKAYLRELHDRVTRDELPRIYEEASKAPVEDKIIVMERGYAPSPSSAHLAEVLESQGRYRIVYMSMEIRNCTFLKYYNNVKEFIRELGTAKAVLITTANDYLSYIDLRPETKVIQLWHGVGTFKKIGYSTISSRSFGLSQQYRDEFDQYKNYSYVTIASEEQAWIFEDAMHISRDSGILAPVGISRTDLFYDDEYKAEARRRLNEFCPGINGRKILLYAPTFRGTVNNAKAPDKLDVEAFGEALSEDYVLLIKHHSVCENRRPPIPEKWAGSFAYDINASTEISIEDLLVLADVCITDYSSIAFEYSILERPILFFAYDLDDYIDERGMYLDYSELTPGPVCRTNKEMIEYIKALPGSFEGEYADEIHAFRQKYVNRCDGHATERTIALIEK